MKQKYISFITFSDSLNFIENRYFSLRLLILGENKNIYIFKQINFSNLNQTLNITYNSIVKSNYKDKFNILYNKICKFILIEIKIIIDLAKNRFTNF